MRDVRGRQQQVIAAKWMIRQGFRSCRSRPPPQGMWARCLVAGLACATSKRDGAYTYTSLVVQEIG
ncbi:MAG: hypothetical protein OJF49_003787 [Ktedonobacterales bacterium]|nr:MAG: hypothetical protein OJF49_003787 [Ktedonobacterales bacterium]